MEVRHIVVSLIIFKIQNRAYYKYMFAIYFTSLITVRDPDSGWPERELAYFNPYSSIVNLVRKISYLSGRTYLGYMMNPKMNMSKSSCMNSFNQGQEQNRTDKILYTWKW